MSKTSKAQDITFILVRPRYPGNIGSTARAIKNMGFTKLSLVRPSVLPDHPEALRLAVGAADLLKKAKVFDTIEEAAKGLHFLIGTSRRTGKYRQDFVMLPELAEHLPKRKKIGILFGPEERGLSNKELAYCHLVTAIPSNPDFASLNLSQAVMVIVYQLRVGGGGFPSAGNGQLKNHEMGGAGGERYHHPPASIEAIEGMYQHLEKMLDTIGFFPHKNSFHMMRAIRQVFGRTGLTEREVRIFRGLCRQVLWSTQKKEGSIPVQDQQHEE